MSTAALAQNALPAVSIWKRLGEYLLPLAAIRDVYKRQGVLQLYVVQLEVAAVSLHASPETDSPPGHSVDTPRSVCPSSFLLSVQPQVSSTNFLDVLEQGAAIVVVDTDREEPMATPLEREFHTLASAAGAREFCRHSEDLDEVWLPAPAIREGAGLRAAAVVLAVANKWQVIVADRAPRAVAAGLRHGWHQDSSLFARKSQISAWQGTGSPFSSTNGQKHPRSWPRSRASCPAVT